MFSDVKESLGNDIPLPGVLEPFGDQVLVQLLKLRFFHK
jgi:hypothetical protein